MGAASHRGISERLAGPDAVDGLYVVQVPAVRARPRVARVRVPLAHGHHDHGRAGHQVALHPRLPCGGLRARRVIVPFVTREFELPRRVRHVGGDNLVAQDRVAVHVVSDPLLVGVGLAHQVLAHPGPMGEPGLLHAAERGRWDWVCTKRCLR